MADMKAVRFDRYGDLDVLEVHAVPRPTASSGRVLVRVRAAGINPGEVAIRKGLLHGIWPASFPSGQGSDLAGIVEEIGDGVSGFTVGDHVYGFTNERGSHAQFVAVPAEQLALKPAGVSFETAGSLFVAGSTAYAMIRALELKPGETVAIAAAAGGVGGLAVQLAKRAGAHVLAIAGADNDAWLQAHGAVPVNHGSDLAPRLRAATSSGRIDAFLDCFGGGYVALAIEQLGIDARRVNTIIDFEAAAKYGATTVGGADAANIEALIELVRLIEAGELQTEIARTYPLDDVRDAYRELERQHTRGKIVLYPP